jgi:hypothetical protein
MSVTQDYKNVSLSSDEITNVFEALLDREDHLRGEIKENEAIDWKESAARGRRNLEIVQGLIKRLEAM